MTEQGQGDRSSGGPGRGRGQGPAALSRSGALPWGSSLRGWRVGRGAWVGLVVLVVGLALGEWRGQVSGDEARAATERALKERARALKERIVRGLLAPQEVLASVQSLLTAQPDLSAVAFAAFADAALARHRAITALEWAPYVTAQDRLTFEVRMRAQGAWGFEITEPSQGDLMLRAAPREAYLPLAYIAPAGGGLEAGFDLLSEARRRRDVLRIRAAGETTATGRIRLIEDPPGVYAVVTYAPVYALGKPTATEAERAAAFRGMAIMLLRMSDIMERVLSDDEARAAMAGAEVALIDASAEQDADALLFESAPDAYAAMQAQGISEAQALTFGGRQWRLVVAVDPDGAAAAAADAAARATFWLGALLSSLCAAVAVGWRALGSLRGAVRQAQAMGQYQLIRPIGEGGMGTVYLAKHALLRRPTAVKVLRPDPDQDQLLARFEREVTLTSRLTHPNTIAVYDYGRTRHGSFFYAMELLDGLTLQALVTQHGAQPAGRVVEILRQALGALAEAHALGLIHRDIKPANLMLTRRGLLTDFLKVLDFGLVKDTRLSASLEITQAAQVIGTPYYLSPEAIQGEQAIDHRADLYALGAVAYFLLTAEVVFDAIDMVQLCYRHVHTAPTPPSRRGAASLSPDLEALVLALLAKSPDDRPQSALAALDRLERIADVPPWTTADAQRWWDTHYPPTQDGHASAAP